MTDHYFELGVDRNAAEADIVSAYRVLIRNLHPDVAGTETSLRAATVNHAYDVLRDPASRRDYDRTLEPIEPAVNTGQSNTSTAGVDPHSWPRLFELRSPLTAVTFTAWVFAVIALIFTVVSPGGGLWASVGAGVVVVGSLTGFALMFGRIRYRVAGFIILAGLTIGWSGAGGWPLVAAFSTAVSSVCLLTVLRRKRMLREARAWADLMWVNGREGHTAYWVSQVIHDGQTSRVLGIRVFDDQAEDLNLWGICDQGEWILVGSGQNIIGSIPNSAPVSFEKMLRTAAAPGSSI